MNSIERWEQDPDRGSFRGWLYRITRNLSIDFLRKANRRPRTGNDTTVFKSIAQLPDESDFDLQLERQVFRRAAQRLEKSFTDNTWKAFWLTAVEGRSIEEVAAELRISRGAIYIARSRVMSKLRTEVQVLMNETMGH